MSALPGKAAASRLACPPTAGADGPVAAAVRGLLAAAADTNVRPGAVWPLHRALLDMRREAARRGLPDPLGGAPTARDAHVGEAVEGASAAVWELRRSADLVPSPDGEPVLVVAAGRRAALRRRLLRMPAEQASLMRWGSQRWNAWECAAANASLSAVPSAAPATRSSATRRQPPPESR